MRLDSYKTHGYSPGAPLPVQLLWWFIGAPLVRSYLIPFSAIKVFCLRLFGAQVPYSVRIKPGVQVKFPWRLTIGEHSWVGERVWIDNLASVRIGSHCCVSQAVYLCTGNHDWSAADFALRLQEITVSDRVWLGARSSIAPGSVIEEGAVVAFGSVACGTLQGWTIYAGNPAVKVRNRQQTTAEAKVS